ncbi:MAG: hypothetical protein AAF629_21925 [Chloroflexota bacterium]
MTEVEFDDNAYIVQTVDIINAEDKVAFALTEAGGYVVEAIPKVGIDVREVDILFVAPTLEAAIEKYENVYG